MLRFAAKSPWGLDKTPNSGPFPELLIQVDLGWGWECAFLTSSLVMLTFLVPTLRGFPLWEPPVYTVRGWGLFEKKNTKLFFTLYKIYLLFHILQTLGGSLPDSWKGCSKWGTLRFHLPCGQATTQGACFTDQQRKRISCQLSSRLSSLHLEHLTIVVFIVTTRRQHSVYKLSL